VVVFSEESPDFGAFLRQHFARVDTTDVVMFEETEAGGRGYRAGGGKALNLPSDARCAEVADRSPIVDTEMLSDLGPVALPCYDNPC